jgi:SAM-dependent methyltransferase
MTGAELGHEFWEGRYRDHGRHGHRHPNAQLVQLVQEAGVAFAGRALDAGCGEGADALWLAARGWQVTAVDFAGTALRRARARADQAGAEIAGRIDWLEADLTGWSPPRERFDLVSSQYVHVPAVARETLFRGLAAAVAPGGTLLVVGHDVSELDAASNRGEDRDLYLAADDVAAVLDPARWDVTVAETRARPGHDGHGPVSQDAVLRARRRT